MAQINRSKIIMKHFLLTVPENNVTRDFHTFLSSLKSPAKPPKVSYVQPDKLKKRPKSRRNRRPTNLQKSNNATDFAPVYNRPTKYCTTNETVRFKNTLANVKPPSRQKDSAKYANRDHEKTFRPAETNGNRAVNIKAFDPEFHPELTQNDPTYNKRRGRLTPIGRKLSNPYWGEIKIDYNQAFEYKTPNKLRNGEAVVEERLTKTRQQKSVADKKMFAVRPLRAPETSRNFNPCVATGETLGQRCIRMFNNRINSASQKRLSNDLDGLIMPNY